jgi:hypothetical protein
MVTEGGGDGQTPRIQRLHETMKNDLQRKSLQIQRMIMMYREKIKPKPRSDKWDHIENQPIKSKVVLAANTPKSSLLLHNLADSK